MVPSALVVNHSGCAATHGWSGAQLSAKSIATSRPSAPARATNASKSSRVPRSGWTASWPPSLLPIAQGDPGSSGPGSRVLLGPLRLTSPIGWIGGRYTMSNPMAATASSRFAAVANVPLTAAPVSASYDAPSDRGKNSYQFENSARTRSAYNG